MDKIIFLDIDGVLNDYMAREHINSDDNEFNINLDKVYLLQKLVEKTNAKIVVTSNWRYDKFNELINFFKDYGIEIIAKTKNLEINSKEIKHYYLNNNIDYQRSMEILTFIKSHNLSEYIILDDVNLLDIPEIQNHFIQTPEDDGLQDYLIEEAINLLKNHKL